MTVGATNRLAGVDLAAGRDRAGALVEETLQPLEVPAVDDAAEARARLRVGSVELADLAGQLVDEAVLDRFVDQDVVGRDAGLPGVEELAPRDAASSHIEVGARVHVRG